MLARVKREVVESSAFSAGVCTVETLDTRGIWALPEPFGTISLRASESIGADCGICAMVRSTIAAYEAEMLVERVSAIPCLPF